MLVRGGWRPGVRKAVFMLISREWATKYRDALLERHPSLQLLRIAEAYDAIFRRLKVLGETSNEHHKLRRALDALNRLRDT